MVSALIFLHFILIEVLAGDGKVDLDDFFSSEELLIRPLPDGQTLVHFEFKQRINIDKMDEPGASSNFGVFPKAIGQLTDLYDAEKFQLKFVKGRWNEQWGEPIVGTDGASGVELWAVIPSEGHWHGLKSALSGLFCASLDLMDEKITSSAHFARLAAGLALNTSSNIPTFYATLPRETVCTENLTPWLKLLPCRFHEGLASVIDARRLYDSSFSAMTIRVERKCLGLRLRNVTTPCRLRAVELTQVACVSIYLLIFTTLSIFINEIFPAIYRYIFAVSLNVFRR
jgi:phosphatidylinositol glycan class T